MPTVLLRDVSPKWINYFDEQLSVYVWDFKNTLLTYQDVLLKDSRPALGPIIISKFQINLKDLDSKYLLGA